MHPNNYRRYRRKKRNTTIKNVLILIMLFIIGSGIAFFLMQEEGILFSMGSNKEEMQDEPDIESEVLDIVPEESEPVEKGIMTIYLDILQANDEVYLNEIFQDIADGTAEALIIPMKNSDGTFNYESQLYYKSTSEIANDFSSIIARAIEEEVYLIADFPVYHDANFTQKNSDTAIKTTSGYNWVDDSGGTWVSPYAETAKTYMLQLVTEISKLGFDEIILSDFHFPVNGDYSTMRVTSEVSKEDILMQRLDEFSQVCKISLIVSDYIFTTENSETGENLVRFAEKVENIYINVTNEQEYEQYNALSIENKVIISSNDDYLIGQSSYIKS